MSADTMSADVLRQNLVKLANSIRVIYSVRLYKLYSDWICLALFGFEKLYVC